MREKAGGKGGRKAAKTSRLPGLDDAPLPLPEAEPPPHYLGHRDRLRERFLATGGEALPDYELLELLLFSAIPRKDVKPLAKDLIAKHGSLANVLSATADNLEATAGISRSTAILLKAVEQAGRRLSRAEAMEQPVIGSWDKLIDYCRSTMAREPREQFRLLFLDRRNRLIADEVQQTGTVDHTPAYPREVVRRALEVGATAIVLAHNHPSGDPNPSKADIAMTRQISQAAETMGIVVHDHVIISKSGHVSFKTLGLL